MKYAVRQPWLWRAALGALVLAAYANSFGLGFAYDGEHLATQDTRVLSATGDSVRQIFTTPYWYPTAEDNLYRPLTTLSFLFNHAVLKNETNPIGYHVLNFLLHLLNVLLVFELARRLIGWTPGFAAAAIWAVHPVGTEAVSNLAGRADLLAAACVLGALVVYAGGDEWWRAPVVGLLCLAGGLSKESALLVPGLLVLWDGTSGRKPGWGAYLASGLAIAAVLAARGAVFQAAAWPQQDFVDNPLRGMGFWTARLTALRMLGMDLGLLVWPANLAFDHSYNQIPAATWRDASVWVTGAVVFELLALVALRRKRDPILFFAAGFYGLTLLPASNLAVPIGSTMAVRFSYLPAVGFAIAAAALLFRLSNRRMAYAVVGLAVAAFGIRTTLRNPAWDSNLALGTEDVGRAPASFRTHRLYSNALVKADPDANLDEGIRQDEIAWEILSPLPPEASDANTAADLGYLYALKGDREGGADTVTGRAWYVKSEDMLEAGVRLAAASRRHFDEVQLAHRKPLRFQGGYERLYLNLGKTYKTLGRTDAALAAFRKARAENPNERDAYVGIAGVALERGDLDAAAVAAVEMAMLSGIDAAAVERLRSIYRRIPGGECALAEDAGRVKLNLSCPRMGRDVCAAWAEMAAVFESVRSPDLAAKWRDRARAAGCPVL